MVCGIVRLSYWRIGMDYGRQSYVRFAGPKSISGMVACMSIELRAGWKASIPSKVQRYEHYDRW
jgi:hypothetical protein